MSTAKPALAGSDWTKILSDPVIADHLGELLKAYREARPEKRDEALLEAMRRIKGGRKQDSEVAYSLASTPAPTAKTSSAPPFAPGLFAPTGGTDRRRFPRMKCFVAVELRTEQSTAPIWGTLSNISPGGCFVEAPTLFGPGIKLDIGLWIANGKLWIKGLVLNGIVTSFNPSSGSRIRFADLEPSGRETLRQFLEYVVETTKNQEQLQNYLTQMKR